MKLFEFCGSLSWTFGRWHFSLQSQYKLDAIEHLSFTRTSTVNGRKFMSHQNNILKIHSIGMATFKKVGARKKLAWSNLGDYFNNLFLLAFHELFIWQGYNTEHTWCWIQLFYAVFACLDMFNSPYYVLLVL